VRSPIYWAVLGLVIERAGYGYELLKRFERDYGEALPLSSDSHIYRALSVLESKGLIQQVPVRETDYQRQGRQPRPQYQATPAGVCGYRDWLIAQVQVDRRRSWLFVRELAVFVNEPRVALEIIERWERACLEEAERGHALCADGPVSDTASGLAAVLSAEESRLAMQAQLPWVHYARQRFTALVEAESASDEPA
jgi:DNA-binding PadR family transcriptional regulator